jgi:hypothetical protein
MENISKHIAYNEATYSDTAKRNGISNIPTTEQLSRMKLVAEKVFEPLREHFNVPIHVSSMFRSEALNKAIGGAKTSQHMALNGAAIDLDADKYGRITNVDIFEYIKDNLEFDQLIIEDVIKGHAGWVHVSYKEFDNRNQILIMYKENDKTKYLPYTEDNLNKLIK